MRTDQRDEKVLQILDDQFCITLRELTDLTEGSLDCFKEQAYDLLIQRFKEILRG